jgi:CheY-like chemotaxis protein
MDDEEMIRELIFNLLSGLGCDVTTCENGESAVELYEASRRTGRAYSVVILDLLIPGGIGGIETAQRILQIDPEACLLVSSGYSDDPAISDFKTYGFCGSISKPYNSEQLEHALAEVLAVKAL